MEYKKKERNSLRICVIGSAQHGKDTVAEMIKVNYGLKHKSSSVAALEIFLFDTLRLKYGLVYDSMEDAYEDRVNHRDKWYNEICEYNKDDKARLAKDIMKDNDIYVGMRSAEEIAKCKEDGVFDFVLGVFDPRKPNEDSSSNSINVLEDADAVIMNDGTLEDLEMNVVFLMDEKIQ